MISNCKLRLNRMDRRKHIFSRKPALRRLYEEVYREYARCIEKGSQNGIVVEIGSGTGFIKNIIPQALASDIEDYVGLDMVFDAHDMPFENESISTLLLHNVFHHLRDVECFFFEAQRCLVSEGRILIADQYCGFFSRFILKYVHFENFDDKTIKWQFDSHDPLIDANGALPYLVFQRDIHMFEQKYPRLAVERVVPHSPLRYWFAGGLKRWSLLPNFLFGHATSFDHFLLKINSKFGSFVFIELKKKAQ